MKADLYVQGQFWATLELPRLGLIALLGMGMITEAQCKAHELDNALNQIDGVTCSISLNYKLPATYIVPDASQDPHHASP